VAEVAKEAGADRLLLYHVMPGIPDSWIIENMFKKNKPHLNDTEKQEPYAKYYDRESAKVPTEVVNDIERSPYPSEKALLFENINDLLKYFLNYIMNTKNTAHSHWKCHGVGAKNFLPLQIR